MQESLFNTVQKLQTKQKIDVEELEVILNSDIEEVVSLCKKACLKPKTDAKGNAYFDKDDVDTLKKMKELYTKSQTLQNKEVDDTVAKNFIDKANGTSVRLDSPNKKINFLEKAKTRIKNETPVTYSMAYPSVQLQNKLDRLENNILSKMGDLLSEKMDGFDEIIVELIRAKTENENLRQQVNSLNKQVYILKGELASYIQMPLGLYIKKDTNR